MGNDQIAVHKGEIKIYKRGAVAERQPFFLAAVKISDRTTKKPENLDSKGFPVSVCDKIRTRDLLVRSQTLYPAELHIHFCHVITAATT